MDMISQDRLESTFGDAWKKLGFHPTPEHPLANISEVIWERVKLNHANDPGDMPTDSILKQTIYQFCRYALKEDL